MAKRSVINIRTDSTTKQAIESLYSQFGITVSDAVNIFFPQITDGRRVALRYEATSLQSGNRSRHAGSTCDFKQKEASATAKCRQLFQ